MEQITPTDKAVKWIRSGCIVSTSEGAFLCETEHSDQAEAIARILNNHVDLLKAARRARSVLHAQGHRADPGNVIDALNKAIGEV
jgi:hypothetical protein